MVLVMVMMTARSIKMMTTTTDDDGHHDHDDDFGSIDDGDNVEYADDNEGDTDPAG